MYYTWKNRRQLYKNNKFQITAPLWNDEFEFLVCFYSVSDVQDNIEYIVKKLKTSTNPPSCICINRLVFQNKRWI